MLAIFLLYDTYRFCWFGAGSTLKNLLHLVGLILEFPPFVSIFFSTESSSSPAWREGIRKHREVRNSWSNTRISFFFLTEFIELSSLEGGKYGKISKFVRSKCLYLVTWDG